MKKASTRLLEQETQTPSPAPDLIPAESSTENLHWDWYSKRGTSEGRSVITVVLPEGEVQIDQFEKLKEEKQLLWNYEHLNSSPPVLAL